MEIGNKRHGKKSDKETQSPVLKVFKEMIQRENKDPEKANLLKEKQENRKRRQYSVSRSKSDRANRSCDSSSSEKNRRNVQYNVAVHEQRLKDYNQRSDSFPFQGDKKDSWWFCGETKKSEETCSCVSCALKKIISSEYTCIACLSVIFLLSVLVAFMVLFKAVPCNQSATTKAPFSKKSREIGSDVLKGKIDMIQRGCKDGSDDRAWDDTLTRHLSSLTGSNGNDFDDGSYRELVLKNLCELHVSSFIELAERLESISSLSENTLEDSGRLDDISSVLDAEKLNDGLSSERLRNFYKKLIQTDAQIRNMKKSVNEYTQTNNEESKYYYPDRSKRSLRLAVPKSYLRYDFKKDVTTTPPVLTENNQSEIDKFNIFYPPYTNMNGSNQNNKKFKRFFNETDEPSGFVIEKKQLVVQYKPHDYIRKVPKCSHAPKDSKSHEKQLKHPFYKNSQRLDELLDMFLDKSLPEMMADPFGVDTLFKHNNDFKTHKTNVKIENEKETKKPVAKMKNNEDKLFSLGHNRPSGKRVGELDTSYFNMVSSKKKGKIYSTTELPSHYDVILSVSTIVNPEQRKVTKPMNIHGRTPSLLERVPHIRKLMQVDEEDEDGLGYEDVNEVLSDDTEPHDEVDKGRNRKKRMDDYNPEDFKIPNNPYKYNPPGVHNPNWKGPMPLYPDELSSMIKQAAIQNVQNYNKIHLPSNTKDMPSAVDSLEKDLNDMEYMENYSNNKYEKLAKMAQAYSDYGVLEDKKDSARNEKSMDSKKAERRVKLSINKRKSIKNAFIDRFKKSKVSEGIRFEIRPTTQSNREDKPIHLLKALKQHVKVTNGKYFSRTFPTTAMPVNTEYALFSTVEKQQATPRREPPLEYSDNGVVFTFAKNGRRSLMSFEEDSVKSIENINHQNNQDSKLIIKGISGLKKSDNTTIVDTDIDTEVAIVKNHHHDHHHHHSDNHNDNKYENNTIYNKVKLEERASNLNETDNIIINKHNVTDNGTRSNNTDSVANVQDNNLISTILNLNAPRNSSESISDSNMALSDFFLLMSNWFSVMAGFDTGAETNEPNSNIIKLINKSETLNTTPKSNDSKIEFPMYDSDMIENIGHRSRVLMSVEDNNTVDISEINTSAINGRDEEITSIGSAINSHKEDVSTISPTLSTTEMVIANATSSNTPQNQITLANSDKFVDNKTLVKRNVPDDSNLIFWNDIYDDEYGVKIEPIDDALTDKANSKSVNIVKKSGNWIQDKVKNFANNFRGKDKMNMSYRNYKRRVLRKANYREDPRRHNTNKYIKRSAEYEEADTEDKNSGFAALTAKMKEVCKEAAKAVHETKNIQVRQDDKENTMTTSLMQQLVRLMTDLVDFQVQQKTCVKLPPDLQQFLAWLTAPNSEQIGIQDQKLSYQGSYSYDKPTEQILDLVTTPSSEKEMQADSRSDCLGTLHAVQDLMQQYDEMTDEDKSKMTGIRDYLESQLQFLHKQLSTFDGTKMSHLYEDQNPSYRFRRDLPSKGHHTDKNNHIKNKRSNLNRFKRRFLKNFGKKHTKTTASIYDGFAMTEMNKLSKDDIEKGTNKNVDQRQTNNVKRNLKDVYYKALNDAKKSSTYKTTLKEEMEGFDHANIVRIDN